MMSLSEIIEVEKNLNLGSDDFVAFQTVFPEHHLVAENARLVAGLADLRRQQEEVRRQTEELVDQARHDRDRIINEEEKRVKEAEERGFAKGQEEGRRAGRQELAAQIKDVSGLFEKIDEQRLALASQYEEELLRLVQVMVERLVNRELSIDPQGIKQCLNDALEYVAGNARVQVHLHEDDFAFLQSKSDELSIIGGGSGRIELISDQNISRGGCLLATDLGEVDVTLETCRARLFQFVDDSLRPEGK